MLKALTNQLGRVLLYGALLGHVNIVFAQDPISLGVSPWTNKGHILKWSQSVVHHLENQSGKAIRLASADNLQLYMRKAMAQQFDAMFAPIHLALYLIKHHGYRPYATLRSKGNLLIVAVGSPQLSKLEDLKGVEIILPHELSGASLVAKHALREKGIPFTARVVNDHWQVMEALKAGRVKVGAVLDLVYEMQGESFRQFSKEVYRNPISWDALLIFPPKANSALESVFEPMLNAPELYKHTKFEGTFALSDAELEAMFESLAPYLKDLQGIIEAGGYR